MHSFYTALHRQENIRTTCSTTSTTTNKQHQNLLKRLSTRMNEKCELSEITSGMMIFLIK